MCVCARACVWTLAPGGRAVCTRVIVLISCLLAGTRLLLFSEPTALRAVNSGSEAGGIPPLRLPPWEPRTLPRGAGLGQGYSGLRPLAGEHWRPARSQVSPFWHLIKEGPLGAPGGVCAKRQSCCLRVKVRGGRCFPPPPQPSSGHRPSCARRPPFAVLPPSPACRPGFTIPGPPGVTESSSL